MKANSVFTRTSIVFALGAFLNLTARAEGSADRVTAIRPNVGGQVIKARIGPDGMIHLLLQDTDGPKYATSRDNGRTFGLPISIVNEATQKPGLEFHGEDLAIGKGGRVFVA